ncbi:hypothetical protein D2T29_12515 [Sinirhodobacter populi]|uniref:Uncharacterized protein n=1 Tax=Paenirhodobacter populi TaxID=2306993 RepID=A0A443KCF6_9RHOB|nr:hypothetical protein [Sinirhodobacter populi]RWR30487.1 hypothetical protein D2T29_12515 [Sinirhodobacter populi]
MPKANDERIWLLQRWWGYPGWSGYPGEKGIKKWDAHVAWMVNAGWLEQDPDCPAWRITDAGRAAISKAQDAGK